MADSTDRDSRGAATRDAVFSAAIFVLALLPRLYVAIAWAREPVWDGHYYDFGARRIAAGLGYSDDLIVGGQTVWHPWCHYPVGYSAFLAAIYRVFGSGPRVGTIANALIGALLVVLVHRLARYATTTGRARAAAIIAAISPGLIAYSALLMTEPLAALGIVTCAWLVARDADQRWMRGAALAGLALGVTTLIRPQSLLCAPALGFILWKPTPRSGETRRFDRYRRVGTGLAIALGTALLVVMPWTIRNCRVMDGCAFVSTNAGWNLAIGSFPRATGRFETLHASDGCPVVTGQVQQDRCWLSEGIRWIREDPLRWLGLAPRKLAQTFDHESFPMGYLGEADPGDWPEERKSFGRGVLTGAHRALVALSPFGLLSLPLFTRTWPRRIAQIVGIGAAALFVTVAFASDLHPFWSVVLLTLAIAAARLPGAPRVGGVIAYLVFAIATVCVTHVLFFGEDRYHMVITPALCILAACALRPPGDEADPPRSDAGPLGSG